MSATININALGGAIGNPAQLEADMIAIGGGAGLAMDANNIAQSLKHHAGSKPNAIVARRYRPDDATLWERIDPVEWLNSVAADGANGVLIQAHNEPKITPENVAAFVAWNVKMIAEAHRRGLNVTVGAFAVGNPHETLIQSGAFDAMLKALGPNDALMVHEYFINDPLGEGETGWLCFRCEEWLERMRLIGCICRTLVVGEYGRDVGGGERDGWRDTGWSVEYYIALLDKGMVEYDRLAAKFSFRIFVDIFCGGHGFGNRWQSFNIEGERKIYDWAGGWNGAHPQLAGGGIVADTYPAGSNPKQARINPTFTNKLALRAAPTKYGAIKRYMAAGEVVTYYAEPVVTKDGFDWVRVLTGADETGWSAKSVGGQPSFVPIVTDTLVLKLPFKKAKLTSAFDTPRDYSVIAPDKLQKHEGADYIDVNAQTVGSDPIVHVGAPAKVLEVGFDANGYGNYVYVSFIGNEYRAYYAHLAEVYVKTGATLKDWQIIGLMGSTGYSTGPHLHLTLQRIGGGAGGYVVANVVNPELYFVPVG